MGMREKRESPEAVEREREREREREPLYLTWNSFTKPYARCLVNKKGITLIALVITIIVLLLLAGISISMLSGDNSILKNAQKAGADTENAEVEEKVKIAVMGAFDDNGNFNGENLKTELDKLGVTHIDEEDYIFIDLPNGKTIMVSTTTGEIKEVVRKITYNYNGGEDIGEVPNDDTEYEEGENITIKFTPIAEREGFEFLGWSTSMTATDAEYKVDGTKTVTMEKRGIRLYAVWKGIPHTVSYDANTGEGSVPTDGNTHIRGENVTVSFDPKPTKAGYTFIGWSEDKDSESAEYTEDGIKTIKMPAKDVKLYAIWMLTSNIPYTVEHYQMDTSGNYSSTPIGSNKYTNGRIDTSITVADLKKDYAGFSYIKGQVEGKDVETTMVLRDGSRVIKLYYERNKYTINFDGNGGSNPATITAYYEATIILPNSAKNGYKFVGWYTSASGGTQTSYTSMPINGATLYAHWRELKMGDEVTVGGERFFVIENTTESKSEILLLSKFCLNVDGTAQENVTFESYKCVFSSSKYWTGTNVNLRVDKAPEGGAHKKAVAYGASKGGQGGLMAYTRAESVAKTLPGKIYGTNIGAVDGYLDYWSSHSHPGDTSGNSVYRINGSAKRLDARFYYGKTRSETIFKCCEVFD